MKSKRNLVVRNGLYYWRETIRGIHYKQSTGIRAGVDGAEKRARAIIREKRKAVESADVAALNSTKIHIGYARIGEIMPIFIKGAAKRDMSPRAVKCYINSLRRVLVVARGISNFNEQPLSILSASLVDDYELAALEMVAGKSASDRRRRRNTIASTLNQARSLFSRWACLRYKRAGLSLPDLDGFRVAGDVKRDMSWDIPPVDLVDYTKAESAKLKGDRRDDLWAVWLLCYGLALRSEEAAHVRWSWIYDVRGQISVDVIKRPDEWRGPKRTEGHVPVPDDILSELQRIRREDDEFVLPGGSITARRNLIGRDFATWIRGCGWHKDNYIHCAHEMRRLRGSEWWTNPAVGPVACSAWLRHSSLAVTQRHYAKLMLMPEPAGL